jgi:hypothetical protein
MLRRLACALWLSFSGCGGSGKEKVPMQLPQLLNAVTDETIEFVTTRDDRTPLPVLGRRVIVTGPPDVVRLLSIGDINVLEGLVGLLLDPNRAWAAEVVLAALTGNEADIVNAFAAHPDQWKGSVGKNAHGRWSEWLTSRRDGLF